MRPGSQAKLLASLFVLYGKVNPATCGEGGTVMALCIQFKERDIMGLKYVDLVFTKHIHDYYTPPNFKFDRQNVKVAVELLKQIPVNERLFDAATNVWTIPQDKFTLYREAVGKIDLIPAYNIEPIATKYATIQDFITGHTAQRNGAWTPRFEKKSQDEFFYQKVAPPAARPTRTLPQLLLVLSGMTHCSVADFESNTRKYYRLGAMLYHPDRNQGDHTKWDLFESAWKEYQGILKKQQEIAAANKA